MALLACRTSATNSANSVGNGELLETLLQSRAEPRALPFGHDHVGHLGEIGRRI